MKFSLPSKTFLLGEYAVLAGGPALVVNTSPRFEFDGNQFFDPHQKRGGFGASSSEWLFQLKDKDILSDPTPLAAKKMISDYRKEFWNGEGLPPSGYDIISQWIGNVAHIDLENNHLETRPWELSSIGFFVVRTGNKIPTYLHLREIAEKNLSPLSQISRSGIDSFRSGDGISFVRAVKEFDSALEKLNLCCDHTRELKQHISNQIPALAVKGCGALGADTVLAFVARDEREFAKSKLKELGLDIVASDLEIDSGWKIEI